MFLHFNNKIANSDTIDWIDLNNLINDGFIRIYYKSDCGEVESVEGAEAFMTVMKLCPAALEGKRAKYQKYAWAIHNFIGHPLMQILSWLQFPKLGIKIHDMTIPSPKLPID